MDLKDLNLDKASIEKLLEGVVEAAVDELYKAEPNHATPGLNDDFAESDAVAASEGVTVKADEDDEEDDDDEKEGNPFKDKKAAECDETEAKSNTSAPDLTKALMKSVIGMQKAITGLSEKVDSFAKGPARTPKAVTKENDVEIIEKGNKEEIDLDVMIKAQPRLVGAALAKMQSEGKIPGQYLTEFELFGTSKLTNTIKKAALAEANLIK